MLAALALLEWQQPWARRGDRGVVGAPPTGLGLNP